jgi:DNA-binding NarL/FixJ family response regulator
MTFDAPAIQATTAPIKVAIIEDLREVREGLAMLINGTSGFSCVGSFRSMETAIANLGDVNPDMILTDIGLPGMDGIAGIAILREQFPGLPCLALTVYDDDERIFAALCAGAIGYLLKNTQPTRLLEALREVQAGGAPMSPEVARRVITLFQNFTPPQNALTISRRRKRNCSRCSSKVTATRRPHISSRSASTLFLFIFATSTKSFRSIRNPKPSQKRFVNISCKFDPILTCIHS